MKLLLVLLVAFSLSQSFNQSDGTVNDWSQQAEAAYAKGDFKEAAKLYQEMIDEGIQTAEIYFNLGNTYYQLHDLGHALVNYRRAAQLIPRDEDLRLNIARVRAQRVDAQNAYLGIGDEITQWESDWLSNSEIGQLILVMWWISCGWLMAYILFRRRRQWVKWGAVVSCVVLVVIGVVSGIRVVVENTHPSAVIVSESVPVMTGPDVKYMQIFELHAAGEVRVVERRNDWVRVQLPDLQEGWVEAQTIEVV